MQFQLQPFNPAQAASALSQLADASAFSSIEINEYNRIKIDNGMLSVNVGGKELRRAPALHFVLAGFEHNDWRATRRQMYEGVWSPTQKAVKPVCYSDDGVSPAPGLPGTPRLADGTQATRCAVCPFDKKEDGGYAKCTKRKTILLYLAQVGSEGNTHIDISTPFTMDLPATSLFSQFDANTQTGGTHNVVPLLLKMDIAIEGVIFEANFAQGARAPVFRVAGQIPEDAAIAVINAAKQPDTMKLLTRGDRANNTPALAAPTAPVQAAAPQFAAPVQAAAPQFAAPVQVAAPQFAAPQFAAPVQAAAPQFAAPVQAAVPQFAAPAQVAAPQFTPPAPLPAVQPVAQAAAPANTRAAAAAFAMLTGGNPL